MTLIQSFSPYIEVKMLNNKKLLILGGNKLSCDIVKAAKELGVYTAVLDWYSTTQSPAKLIADDFFDISIKDYQKIEEIINEHHFDGVITGFTDSYLIPYTKICEMNRLPCYATSEQFQMSLDKSLFKQKCIEFGIPVISDFEVNDVRNNKSFSEYPIIIKPIDNSGSRGINIVNDFSNFEESLLDSLQFSEKGKVIIEKYLDCDDVSICYTIQDGDISLSAICDRFIYKTSSKGSVTSGLIYPSKYIKRYIDEIDGKIKKMFNACNMKNGVLFLQAFVDEKSFYFYEMGYRLSGGRHYIFTESQNNISALKCLIKFAITGQMDSIKIKSLDDPNFKKICCQLSILCKSDEIHDIRGIDKIESFNGVDDVTLYYEVGEKIGEEGTSRQIVGRIHITAENISDLQKILHDIQDTLKIYNSKGENLIIDFFRFNIEDYKKDNEEKI